MHNFFKGLVEFFESIFGKSKETLRREAEEARVKEESEEFLRREKENRDKLVQAEIEHNKQLMEALEAE